MTQISVIHGDITTLKVDAIVNAANTSLRGGGGVDGAIHRAAGPELDLACQKLGGCPTGQAKTTPGFNLPAKYIIHTAGPIWRDGHQHEAELLAACYQNSLIEAQQHHCQSIAFPAISTGIYGYPLKPATKIALETVQQFAGELQVIFICFDTQTFTIYQQMLAAL